MNQLINLLSFDGCFSIQSLFFFSLLLLLDFGPVSTHQSNDKESVQVAASTENKVNIEEGQNTKIEGYYYYNYSVVTRFVCFVVDVHACF